MSPWHGDLHKRKQTGGRRKPYRGKRVFEKGFFPTETVIGESKTKKDRGRGGTSKVRLVSTKYVNASNLSTGETKKVEILSVLKNPSNVDYDRRGVITKGTLVNTSIGMVRVTSRPGQSGVLNGILISK